MIAGVAFQRVSARMLVPTKSDSGRRNAVSRICVVGPALTEMSCGTAFQMGSNRKAETLFYQRTRGHFCGPWKWPK